MMIEGNLERLRAHCANIRRYRRLLETRLSDLERAYIARRMSEEQRSVEALLHETFPDRLSLQTDRRRTTNLEMAGLLHPAEAFAHPMDVVEDFDLTSYEKRAILSLWAADACAVKDDPELNQTIDGAVSFDDIVDALCLLESDSDRRTDGSNRKGRRFGSHEADDSPAL
ncbi:MULTISPECIES: hypothetical protein [Bradyrhizobium]|uniref:Uncharacterized protein n=1 Tax=Bradyrhizobium brasilense TaxID=1419277 RepID=A0ABY8JME5_9BRAD|nr:MULTISPECIES: hypothetical protein [Bradyrhizobium]MCP1831615.1 hypothetical protein [Bradyrhizobium sp. USDA 4545]MCP1850551.1 hypothetical protein [Bradyrhizobium sp. USDA 4541]MCP1916452.1 hypothetical protein [Bradyrhizobium sp. USDA 4532]WFU66804.1 hypothetical protein QA636_15430 [Bradyrhizobium brasilense]